MWLVGGMLEIAGTVLSAGMQFFMIYILFYFINPCIMELDFRNLIWVERLLYFKKIFTSQYLKVGIVTGAIHKNGLKEYLQSDMSRNFGWGDWICKLRSIMKYYDVV